MLPYTFPYVTLYYGTLICLQVIDLVHKTPARERPAPTVGAQNDLYSPYISPA